DVSVQFGADSPRPKTDSGFGVVHDQVDELRVRSINVQTRRTAAAPIGAIRIAVRDLEAPVHSVGAQHRQRGGGWRQSAVKRRALGRVLPNTDLQRRGTGQGARKWSPV